MTGRFAVGPKKDLPVVRAELAEALSNGPVEDFVDELEIIKR